MQRPETTLWLVLILAVFRGIVASVLVGARLGRSCYRMPLLERLNILIHRFNLLKKVLILGFEVAGLLFKLRDQSIL